MKKQSRNLKLEPAEDSLALRTVSCGMALLAIVTACIYAQDAQSTTFLYIWCAMTGAYVSYQFRHNRSFWLDWVVTGGVIIVLTLFADELARDFMARKMNFLKPFMHALTGLQALHTFDLRTRTDISIAAMIGLGLMCCTAIVGTDLLFAVLSSIWICMGAFMLYCESVSRTRSASHYVAPISKAGERLPVYSGRRQSGGSAFAAICLLPLLTLILFVSLPRIGSVLDAMIVIVRAAQNNEKIEFPQDKVALAPGDGPLALILRQGGFSRSGTGDTGGGFSSSASNASSSGTTGGATAKGAGSAAGKDKNAVGALNATAAGKGKSGDKGEALANGKGKGKGIGVGPGKKGKDGIIAGRSGQKNSGLLPGPGESQAPQNSDQEGGHGKTKVTRENTSEQDGQMIFRSKENSGFDEKLLMTVVTSQECYFKRTCFEVYDGHKWTQLKDKEVSHSDKFGGPYQELSGVPSLFVPANLPTTSVFQEYTVCMDIGRIIPLAYIPHELNFPFDPVTIDRCGTLISRKPLINGTHYSLIAHQPQYNLGEMRGKSLSQKDEATLKSQLAADLELPADLSPEVQELAKNVAGNGTWFSRAERICDHLRRNYKYELDLNKPPGKEEIAHQFLFVKKSGACGEFATAFVVMCRAAGVPARCVGGFSPGEYNVKKGLSEIRGKHAHAWAEVYAPGFEWVPFDATPTGRLPVPQEQDNSIVSYVQHSLENIVQALTPRPKEASDLLKRANLTGPDAAGTKSPDQNQNQTENQTENQATGNDKPAGEHKNQQESGSSHQPLGVVSVPPALGEPGKTGSKGEDKERSKGQAKNAHKGESQFWNFKMPKLTWREIIWVIVVVPASLLLVEAIRQTAEQMRLNDEREKLERPKPSTLLYLRVADDLKRLKISRHPTDTPEDLMERFKEASLAGIRVHPELQGLCERFLQLYCEDRFGCDDASEIRGSQMKEITDKIHVLVRARPAEDR